MNTKLAINGFGRIGRVTFRNIINNKSKIDIVAINDLTSVETLAHLLKYDSVHGKFNGDVSTSENNLIVNGKSIPVFAERNPEDLPWKDKQIEVVLECTGLFRTEESASKHLNAGAGKVIISAPAKGNIKAVVVGVNDYILDGSEKIISNASCTTNSVAPLLKIIIDNWGVETAFMTTIHAYTGDQRLHDSPHKDLRRARAAANSIIPTTTGAAKAVTNIFPELHGHIGGAGIRVPVIDGSLTDLTVFAKNVAVTADEINEKFKIAAENEFKGILEYTDDPIVSTDIIGNSHSSVFDSQLTSVIGNMIKVVGWYDNETGYSCRLVELAEKISKPESITL
jgi:glyceraldehyde 3-phosphate dehydrogenase